ncbi:MAG: nucleotide exchange factor GrpE [Phycisphaerae bacterium]|nr:nucleotide exchange factor GrpE [Phycisphaerae bacterium]
MPRKATATRRSAAVAKKKPARAAKSKATKAVTTKSKPKAASAKVPTKRAGGKRKPAPITRAASKSHAADASADILARAEADIAAAVDSLNRQMSTAMATLTEVAVAQRGRGEAVIRTAPLDRATATFQRLVSEVVEDKLAEMLPPLIAIRNEMAQRAAAQNGQDGEFFERGAAMLDQVLADADVRAYDARPGEVFDPLIHMAVAEASCGDLADGAVAELLQPGFRSIRGKVIVPARVKVNRR